jgi:hypothetical protein
VRDGGRLRIRHGQRTRLLHHARKLRLEHAAPMDRRTAPAELRGQVSRMPQHVPERRRNPLHGPFVVAMLLRRRGMHLPGGVRPYGAAVLVVRALGDRLLITAPGDRRRMPAGFDVRRRLWNLRGGTARMPRRLLDVRQRASVFAVSISVNAGGVSCHGVVGDLFPHRANLVPRCASLLAAAHDEGHPMLGTATHDHRSANAARCPTRPIDFRVRTRGGPQ